MVVVVHYGGPRLRFVQGWIGVQVFFALSGYLITTLALREVDRRGRLDLRGFYLRRMFRIVPVYLVVLALVMLQTEPNHVGQTKMRAALPYYLTFLNELAPPAAYIQSWTIGIEQKFYLVWPLLAIAMHHPRGFAALRPVLSPAGAVVVAVLFVAGHLQLTGLLARYGEVAVIPFYGLAVCLLVATAVGPGPTRRLLALRPLAFVGERSYSLYLVQGTASAAAHGLLPLVVARPSVRAAVVTWAVAVLLADLLFRWVEQPMIRVGKRVTGRGRQDPASHPTLVPDAGADPQPAAQPAGTPKAQPAGTPGSGPPVEVPSAHD